MMFVLIGLLFVMWSNVGKKTIKCGLTRQMHHVRVDCHHASKGMFGGILLASLVLGSLSVISYYDFSNKLLVVVNLFEVSIHVATITSIICAGIRMRNLAFSSHFGESLDKNLLLMSLFGVYMLCSCSIVAGVAYIQTLAGSITIVSNLFRMTQATLQVVFILVGMRMSSANNDQVHHARGKEFVTFLIACNFLDWIEVLVKAKQPLYSPVQLRFFGAETWSILTHISTPLLIFFRFHSTVCLSHVWKNAWKIKKH